MDPASKPASTGESSTWWATNGAYVVWGVVAAVVGIGGMLGILSFAWITIIPSAQAWWPFRVSVLDKSAHGNIVTAAVTWFGGVVALYTFYININQKERHARAQESRERDLAELQRIEAEFAALADDFAQEAPLARINAAIGLGELARRPDPRREVDGTVLPDPRTGTETWVNDDGTLRETPRPWPDRWRSLKTERNYPYFLRAAHRLAAALHMWDEAAPRAQALRVLREMGEWAKDDGTDEPLLHQLCNALAEANRTAWAQVREQAGFCLAVDDQIDLAGLLGLLLPEYDFPTMRVAHNAFMTDLEERVAYHSAVVAFAAVPKEQRKSREELLNRFYLAGQGFWATRDAFANALRTLSCPPEAPPETIETVWHEKAGATLQQRRSLDLRFVRLFQAHLWNTNLQGANCEWAHFEGAICWEAHFKGANCRQANFEGAICRRANFKGANCRQANFEGANCKLAHFDANTRLEGAEMGQRFGSTTTALTGANWDAADFASRVPEVSEDSTSLVTTDEYDEDLWNFLNDKYPANPPRTPPWWHPATENPATENPATENPATQNTAAQNTAAQNTAAQNTTTDQNEAAGNPRPDIQEGEGASEP